LGNTPNVDILCSNLAGTKFAHIQVKTFRPGAGRCVVGQKAEVNAGPTFYWVLVGLPPADAEDKIEFFIVPAGIMAKEIKRQYQKYLSTPGAKNQERKETGMRTVAIPPRRNNFDWSIEEFRNRWDLIDKALT
jgi:alkylation response protein AidB-like acyl-CoA dehydrogenase